MQRDLRQPIVGRARLGVFPQPRQHSGDVRPGAPRPARAECGARRDWKRLIRRLPGRLFGLRPSVANIGLGPPKDVYFRLKVGPLPTRQFAKKLCGSLRRKGMYCAVMKFTGQPIS